MSHTIEIPVKLDLSYTVTVGFELWRELEAFLSERYPSRMSVLIIDKKVQKFHGDKIINKLQEYFEKVISFTVPEGEKSKSLSQWNNIVDFVLNCETERTTPIISVGGGVTGDLAGFVASTVLRGIPLIHIPTSLLAMVDSSIGGKTGVNHPTGKNLIGAFYQPDTVFTDISFLSTLERAEWVNGLSEILKYGAIDSPSIFDLMTKLTSEGFELSDNRDEWVTVVKKSAEVKADFVSDDTLESGKRAYLNFGHTFGHALEKVAGYGNISHGEAVFTGMVTATRLSELMGKKVDYRRFDPFKSLYHLTPEILNLNAEQLIQAMYHDKKVRDGSLRLVILNDWGHPDIIKCDDTELLLEVWNFGLDYMR